MKNIKRIPFYFLIVLVLFSGLFALTSNVLAEHQISQLPNPNMTSKDYFTDENRSELENLEIKRLDISVSLNNAFAETHILVDFYNPTDRQLEGDFVLDMPYESIVTGYGLDIDGRLVEGVIVEKEQAKKVFEDRIRAGVDPGLAEVTRENAFKSRVFPVNAAQTRTISLRFVSPISHTRPYQLPLSSDITIKDFKVSVMTSVMDESPQIELPEGLDFIWESRNTLNGSLIKSVRKQDIFLSGALSIQPNLLRTHSIEQHPNGQDFIAVSIPLKTLAGKTQKKHKTVRVYWDSSLSHFGKTEQEIAFILQAIKSFKGARTELIEFSDVSKLKIKSGRDTHKLLNALNKVQYHGATDLSQLFSSQEKRKKADLCLLVSDGRFTLGDFPLQKLPCALYTISAASDADRDVLGLLAKYGGGQFIDLTTQSFSTGVNELNDKTPRLSGLELNGANKISDAEWRLDADLFRLVLPVEKHANELTLSFEGTEVVVEFDLNSVIVGNSHSAFWANQHLTSQRAQGVSREDLVAISQAYSVAGVETSFLVLESIQDYVVNNVVLPQDSFSDELFLEYKKLVMEKEQADQREKDSRLQNVISQWEEQLKWYATDFEYKPKKLSQKIKEALVNSMPLERAVQNASRADRVSEDMEQELEEVVVTGTRIGRVSKNESELAPGSIEINAWTPERVYLKPLKGLCGQEFLHIYFEQRLSHGEVPSFYLEMADVLARCDDVEGAKRIVLSALELPTANKDTITAVAYRLLSFKAYEEANELFQQVRELNPESPQSWRNLALALEQQADSETLNKEQSLELYNESMNLLNHVITHPWESNYDGIELISVMEANLIIEKIQRMGGENTLLDTRLRRLLDVDLRILLSWNVDRVDVDLWVDEPSNERVYYSNKLSEIGGRISNDMTNGYGPEEYLLKKTISGNYQIKVDYFNSDVVNPNGATIIRAHIFRNWGRDNQTMEIVDLEFTQQEQDEYLIATVRVP